MQNAEVWMNDNANALRSKNAKRAMQKAMQKRNQGRAEEAKRSAKEAEGAQKRQAPEARRKPKKR